MPGPVWIHNPASNPLWTGPVSIQEKGESRKLNLESSRNQLVPVTTMAMPQLLVTPKALVIITAWWEAVLVTVTAPEAPDIVIGKT